MKSLRPRTRSSRVYLKGSGTPTYQIHPGKHTARPPEYGRAVPWLFLTPSLAAVSVLVLLPFLDVVRRSFFSAMSGQFMGLANYKNVLENGAFRLAAWNTLRFTAVCIPLLLLFSLLLALLVSALKERRGVFKTSFLLPMAIPVASIVLLWRTFFHENGLFNALLSLVGLPRADWLDSAGTFGVLVFSYLWKNTGYDMVLWLSGLTAIPPALGESSALDGAGPLRRFFHITLPGLSSSFSTIAVLSLLNSFKVFREAYLISGSYPNESIYMLQHLFNNWFTKLDVDKMCAGAVLMALAVAALIALLQRLKGWDAA